MANTSLSLSPHWQDYVEKEVRSGRYASVSEVVRAGLRELEDKSRRLEFLRAHLLEGAEQAAAGEFVSFDVGDVMDRAQQSE